MFGLNSKLFQTCLSLKLLFCKEWTAFYLQKKDLFFLKTATAFFYLLDHNHERAGNVESVSAIVVVHSIHVDDGEIGEREDEDDALGNGRVGEAHAGVGNRREEEEVDDLIAETKVSEKQPDRRRNYETSRGSINDALTY